MRFKSFAWSLLLLCGTHQALATTYYVSNSGNDNADGLSDSNAWATISKVNSTSFSPGDQILFERGDSWHNAQLDVSSSGTIGNPITYGAYGSGAKPEILGSIEITSWTNVSGNIWAGTTSVPSNPKTIDYGAQVFFDETNGSTSWGHYETYDSGFSNLSDEYDWTYNGSTVYIYSPTNPNSRYEAVEAPQVRQIIRLLDEDYITFDNLSIKYCINAGIYDQYATLELYGLTVTNCDIGYIGIKNSGSAYGLSVHRSDAYYAYNTIHDCGRRSISLTMYATSAITVENILIEYNHFYHGFHTTGVDAINGGGHTMQSIIIRNNLFEGDPNENIQGEDGFGSNHIYISRPSTGYIGDISIYNNIFTYAHSSAIKIENAGDIDIYYNTFYKFNLTAPDYQALVYTIAPPGPINIKNNIFYNDYDSSDGNRFTCLKIDSGYESQFDIDYNLYYNEYPGTRFYWCNGGTHYQANQWSSYVSATGFDTHSPEPGDPVFVDAANDDFDLDDGSHALDNGVAITGITTDYFDVTRDSPPDLGAIESDANPPTPDTQPPSVPTGLASSNIGPYSVDLDWNSSSDNVVVTSYKVYTGGSNPISVASNSITYSGLNANTSYTFSVSALDAANNESSQSSGLNVTTASTSGYLIAEDFSSSASNFTVISGGTWNVSNGSYLLSSPAPGSTAGVLENISVHNTSVSGDFDLSAVLRITGTSGTWDDATIVFGYQDSSNYYYVSLNESSVADSNTKGIFKVVSGTPTQLADITMTVISDTDYAITIERNGSSIVASVNGTQVASGTDSTFTSGKVGFGSYNDGGQFDELLVSTSGGSSDTQAPTTPTGLSSSNITSSSVDLSWNPSSDNVAVTGYRIYRDSTAIATTSATSYSDSGLSASTGYSYTVTAYDAASNESSQSSAESVTTQSGGGSGLPSLWSHGDVGSVSATGTAAYSSGTFTIEGSGSDIWSTADEFHYVYQSLSGDGEIVARVVSLENTDSWAKAGVMIRETLDANSKEASMILSYSNGNRFQARTTTGGSTSSDGGGSGAPYWVRVVRSGSTFTGYVSSNGDTWSEVDSTTISMATNVYMGLVVTSHNDGTLCTAEFDNVSVSGGGGGGDTEAPSTPTGLVSSNITETSFTLSWNASSDNVAVTGYDVYLDGSLETTVTGTSANIGGLSASTTYAMTVRAKDAASNVSSASSTLNVTTQSSGGNLPSPWAADDVGSVGASGTAAYSSGTFTIEGSGSDIFGTADEFQFVYQSLSGDGEITARVVSIENTNSWAKSGVMIRETLDANSKHAAMVLSASNGGRFFTRSNTGGSTSSSSGGSSAPYWVRIVRSGSALTGYVSSDGSSWSQVGSVSISMATDIYIGLVVCSHNDGVLCTTEFDNVSVTN